MRLLRNRRVVVTAVLALLGISAAWLFASSDGPADAAVVAHATRGEFIVTVTFSGELRAREAVQITVPATAQQAGVWQMRIQSLVPEGTVVRTGDVVAELDRSQLAQRQTDIGLELQRAEAQLEQANLDSTLTLSTAREAIRNLELSLEEKRLAREQAVYEAPTVRRQAEIEFERAERQLTQARSDLITRTEQARARLREVGTDVMRRRNQLQVIQEVMGGFTIRAPSGGMVVYAREWNGRKRTVSSQVSQWDNVVATLPDLTQMESVAYANEIDVRRVAVGQTVAITLDSDPDKRLTGRVTAVANVGEQRPNTDAKVFEVKITVLESDTTLRPGMTTGNIVETLKIPDALYIPLEALNTVDSVSFVYLQSGGRLVRQEVETGAVNDHDVVILRGLPDDASVLLSPPANPERLELLRLPADTARRGPPPALPARP
jgi:multidrug efflux pump subunit AcrA (membrane-fusion protein)